MNIVILDDYQDTVRKLRCAERLAAHSAKVYTNTVKGLGQLSVRLRDADILVLIRERTHITRQLVEKLPRLKFIAQTGRVGLHIDLAACTERGIAVTEGSSSMDPRRARGGAAGHERIALPRPHRAAPRHLRSRRQGAA